MCETARPTEAAVEVRSVIITAEMPDGFGVCPGAVLAGAGRGEGEASVPVAHVTAESTNGI